MGIKTKHGEEWLGLAVPGKAWSGEARHGRARHGKVGIIFPAGLGEVGRCWVRRGMVWLGEARHSEARLSLFLQQSEAWIG